jgi:hypothetical protein
MKAPGLLFLALYGKVPSLDGAYVVTDIENFRCYLGTFAQFNNTIHRCPHISETFVKNRNLIHRSSLDLKISKIENYNNHTDGGHSLDYEGSCNLMGFSSNVD